ncbi:Uncharacterized [Syntrophomonas zehnderi OL-4]|uniref:Uncharacterized n=1 Tax=Syntrophomonas zehnderi OL-4 TaxID=690567 RepID=A0A0E4C9T9_9FIRM|nr:hypothetical protein [Syntrophomonas zehnderi]CFY11375.1 Uncharacterized [Syntrophomonas zehnderi OL-4]
MRAKEGKIMAKQDFLKDGLYTKEQYEGLLVSSDLEQGCYNIGVQLDENTVLVVDHSSDTEVRQKILNWSAQIEDIKEQYNVDTNLQNYTR